MSIDELTLAIDLQTPKDVFWEWNPSVVGRVPLVVHVYIATSSRTAGTTLRTRSACPVTASAASAAVPRPSASAPLLLLLREKSAAGSKVGPGTGGHCLGLGNHVGILVCMFCENGLEDVEEVSIFEKRVRGWWELCGTADG